MMRRQRSFWSLLALSVLWLAIAVTRAVTMIGRPGRWVDVVSLMVFTFVAGLFLARAVGARRASANRLPETPDNMPISPK